jgi:hypothetical protein
MWPGRIKSDTKSSWTPFDSVCLLPAWDKFRLEKGSATCLTGDENRV